MINRSTNQYNNNRDYRNNNDHSVKKILNENDIKNRKNDNSTNLGICLIRQADIAGLAIFNNTPIEYIFDTGACLTMISLNAFEKIKNDYPATVLEPYWGENIKSANSVMIINGIVTLERSIFIPEVEHNGARVFVSESLIGAECLLGRDLIAKVPYFSSSFEAQCNQIRMMRYMMEESLREGILRIPVDQMVINLTMSSEFEDVRNEIIEKIKEISAESLLDVKPILNSVIKFDIEFLDPKQRPIKCAQRRIPQHLKEDVKEKIDTLEKSGIIRKSKSTWAFPLRVVVKPDKSIRITVDYKPLNKVIKIPQYPTPYIPDYFNKLGDAKYYSKIDLKEAYSQLSNTERAIEVTAFICEFGLYEYIGMALGISSAPTVFQKYMEEVLREFIEGKVAFPYLDDILIYTESAEEHIKVLNEVIEVLKKHGLKISGKKCVILTNEIEFLGHIISKGTIKPLPTRAEAINGMKRPETVQEMQRFLGMTNYCRDSIKNYAEIAKPLFDSINVKHIPEKSKLRKKNGQVDGKKVIIEWSEEAELSFNQIRDIMSSDLILKLPDFKHPFIVTTDASDVGYGAALEQNIGVKIELYLIFRDV